MTPILDKKQMTEEDIKLQYITPAIVSKWNIHTLSEFPIPLPPLAEQKRIVARLGELLPLCGRLK